MTGSGGTGRPSATATPSADSGARRLAAVAVLVTLVVAGIGGVAVTAPDVVQAPDVGAASAADPGADLARLHDAGVTGDGVRVGIVDVTGFDVDHPALDGRVVAARAFSPGETVANGGRNGHGTAAASLVAAVAPDADLYLASFDDPDGYRRAVSWLLDRDVDVVVAPVTFYGKPNDGSALVSRVARRAAADGVVFVAPVGNLARGHWTGRYDLVRDGRLRFGASTRNYLDGGGGRDLTLWLSWERVRSGEEYGVDLYWTNGTASRLVARSQPYPADGVPNERIVARVDPRDTYYVEVRGLAEPTGTRLRLVSPTHALQYRQPMGSIAAPATARGVLAIGAVDDRTGRPEPFSSLGPTADGRDGVDLVAPDRVRAAGRPDGFVGSSAAAPYVAGVAALVLQTAPGLGPDAAERLLERTASDLGRAGPDPVTGHGRVDPVAAVRAAANETGRPGGTSGGPDRSNAD